MSFLWFLVGFSGKMGEIMQIWASYRGPTLQRRDPCSGEGPRRSVAEWEAGQALGSPRRSYCSQPKKCYVLFCSAIPLFQGHVHWTNEDPISV